MWQTVFMYLLGLGFTAAAAAAIADYAVKYSSASPSGDPAVVSSVPELNPATSAITAALLLGGVALIASKRPAARRSGSGG